MATWPHNDARTESSHPVSRHPLRARECARGSATRLLLVDGHIAFRELLAFRLAQEPDFRVVAEAGSLAEIRQVLSRGAVDVALVELALAHGRSVALIRELRMLNPEARVVVLTASEDRHAHAVAVAAGASGVVSKSSHAAEIIAAIRKLCAGDVLVTPREAIDLFRLVDQQREAERTAHRLVAQLTPRERQLLPLLAEGLDDAAMAERLGISHKTVRNYMVHILDKFNVDSRLQALVLAARHGLVTLE
jgi:DNA-binding NarL/FixJ family response regulator